VTPALAEVVGRYAPSPSGDLHVGNLRTALLAWLSAHSAGGELYLRIDDLDPMVARREFEERQRKDLARIGVTFTGTEIRQSERLERYQAAIAELGSAGLVYPCFCSRREIREAASAPHTHLPEGAYPGTCRDLSSVDAQRRAEDRPAAFRVRADGALVSFSDRTFGAQRFVVDDFVVQRNDGVPAYNLATVLDDDDQRVTEVVRGADLLAGTPRHIWLRRALGLHEVMHAHVPLVLNRDGHRLAKRDGAVTLADLSDLGIEPSRVRAWMAESVGLADPGENPSMSDLLNRYRHENVPTNDTVWDSAEELRD
jgi:glutamyl-tRNA synthetase